MGTKMKIISTPSGLRNLAHGCEYTEATMGAEVIPTQ
jgi:hypothetical protein